MQTQVIILLGHGSKSIEAIEDFNFIVESMKQRESNLIVHGAHMELAKPSLEDVIARLNTEGWKKIIVLPYFLYNGNHIKEDVPAKIEALKKIYPEMEISFGTPIGKEPLMGDILLKKASELF